MAHDEVAPSSEMPAASGATFSRRGAIASGTALAAILAVSGIGHWRSIAAFAAAPDAPPADFFTLSQMLTGHPAIDPALAAPAWQALCQREQDFPARLSALAKAVSDHGLRDMAGWKASPIAADAALKATAVAIVGAWYLGRVGAVKPQSEDGPAFITYAGALMWRPTFDVTVIPTYARGGPGYWAAKPAAIPA